MCSLDKKFIVSPSCSGVPSYPFEVVEWRANNPVLGFDAYFVKLYSNGFCVPDPLARTEYELFRDSLSFNPMSEISGACLSVLQVFQYLADYYGRAIIIEPLSRAFAYLSACVVGMFFNRDVQFAAYSALGPLDRLLVVGLSNMDLDIPELMLHAVCSGLKDVFLDMCLSMVASVESVHSDVDVDIEQDYEIDASQYLSGCKPDPLCAAPLLDTIYVDSLQELYEEITEDPSSGFSDEVIRLSGIGVQELASYIAPRLDGDVSIEAYKAVAARVDSVLLCDNSQLVRPPDELIRSCFRLMSIENKLLTYVLTSLEPGSPRLHNVTRVYVFEKIASPIAAMLSVLLGDGRSVVTVYHVTESGDGDGFSSSSLSRFGVEVLNMNYRAALQDIGLNVCSDIKCDGTCGVCGGGFSPANTLIVDVDSSVVSLQKLRYDRRYFSRICGVRSDVEPGLEPMFFDSRVGKDVWFYSSWFDIGPCEIKWKNMCFSFFLVEALRVRVADCLSLTNSQALLDASNQFFIWYKARWKTLLDLFDGASLRVESCAVCDPDAHHRAGSSHCGTCSRITYLSGGKVRLPPECQCFWYNDPCRKCAHVYSRSNLDSHSYFRIYGISYYCILQRGFSCLAYGDDYVIYSPLSYN